MTYQEALAFVQDFPQAHAKNFHILVQALALFPGENSFKLIHLAGTNGKGSTGFFLASLLQAEGFGVAHLASPHISDYRERFKINQELIDQDLFVRLVEEVEEKREEILALGGLNYFEMGVLLGFLAARARKVDFLLLEVGIGGRFDVTNAFAKDLAIITPIGLDHEESLGGTLEQIAWHKAGIIQAGVPLVVARQSLEALEPIRREADALGARIYTPPTCPILAAREGTVVVYQGKKVQTPMLGAFQGDNLLTAIKAFEVLGFGLEDRHLPGLAQRSLPGRLERLADQPLILIDGAHNGLGQEGVLSYLRTLEAGKKVLIFGQMADKTLDLALYQEVFDQIYWTRVQDQRTEDWASSKVKTYGRVEEALEAALENLGQEDLIFISGSMYLAGEARDYLMNKQGGFYEERKNLI